MRNILSVAFSHVLCLCRRSPPKVQAVSSGEKRQCWNAGCMWLRVVSSGNRWLMTNSGRLLAEVMMMINHVNTDRAAGSMPRVDARGKFPVTLGLAIAWTPDGVNKLHLMNDKHFF